MVYIVNERLFHVHLSCHDSGMTARLSIKMAVRSNGTGYYNSKWNEYKNNRLYFDAHVFGREDWGQLKVPTLEHCLADIVHRDNGCFRTITRHDWIIDYIDELARGHIIGHWVNNLQGRITE